MGDERWFLDVISGRRKGMAAGLMRGGLSLLTPVYRCGVGLRNCLFDVGAKLVRRVDVPVVSVGNLTTGGTGKTPMVAWLTGWFQSQGAAPAIVSRGYRSLDGVANDERLVLDQLCRGVPHEQDADRVAAATRVIGEHQPGVLILDDGFQHRRLHRDVDVVLVDALNPWGYGRLLPRGLLREPLSSLRRADVVVITRANQIDERERSRLRKEIAGQTSAPIAEAVFRPLRLLSVDGRTIPLSELAGQPVFGFCGIGNPDSFRRTLIDAGLGDEETPIEVFPDHHHYDIDDLRFLEVVASQSMPSALVTTQKDLVKLDANWLGELDVWAIVIGAEITVGQTALESVLETASESASAMPLG